MLVLGLVSCQTARLSLNVTRLPRWPSRWHPASRSWFDVVAVAHRRVLVRVGEWTASGVLVWRWLCGFAHARSPCNQALKPTQGPSVSSSGVLPRYLVLAGDRTARLSSTLCTPEPEVKP